MRRIRILLIAALCSLVAASCSESPAPSNDADNADDAGTVTDSEVEPDHRIMDAGQECDGAICGTITYTGVYSGPSARIFVRAYKATDSQSENPVAAVGHPDFETSIEGVGAYRLELGGYQGSVTLSAFMDVDDSGSAYGPNGRPEPLHGLYSDPIGAYGGYTFEVDPQTRPTSIDVGGGGATGIDIELTDSGVISGTVSGDHSGTLIVGVFEPVVSGPYLHHHEYPTYANPMTYFVVAPPKSDWRVRATVAGAAGFYPQNPPPAPPANTTPVNVVANTITPDIDIAL